MSEFNSLRTVSKPRNTNILVHHETVDTFCGKMWQLHTIYSLHHRKETLMTHNWKRFGGSKKLQGEQKHTDWCVLLQSCKGLRSFSFVQCPPLKSVLAGSKWRLGSQRARMQFWLDHSITELRLPRTLPTTRETAGSQCHAPCHSLSVCW